MLGTIRDYYVASTFLHVNGGKGTGTSVQGRPKAAETQSESERKSSGRDLRFSRARNFI